MIHVGSQLRPWAGSRASACTSTFGVCLTPSAYPGTPTLPANAHGAWLGDNTAATVALRVEPVGAPVHDVAFAKVDRSLPPYPRLEIRIDETLPVGGKLTLDATPACASAAGPSTRTWTIVEAVAKPTALGTLDVSVDRNGEGSVPESAGCSESLPTTVADIELVMDASAEPWRESLAFETVVDGEVWNPTVSASPLSESPRSRVFGDSWRGRGVDRVFVQCGEHPEGVAEGRHTIGMRGILPDGTVLETDPVDVTLRCGSAGCSVDPAARSSVGVGLGFAAVIALALARLAVRRRARQ